MIYLTKGENIEIHQKEVLRYLGCPHTTEEKILKAVEECIEELSHSLACKACFSFFDILSRENEVLDFGAFKTSSAALASHLTGCDKIILLAATIGINADRLIHKYSRISPSKAVICQAVGAAAIEQWCDEVCLEFEHSDFASDRHLTSRFSPGYGDLPLDLQKNIFEILQAPKKIGLTLTDSQMMTPTKSVTAIVGLSKESVKRACGNKCAKCNNLNCEFRVKL